MPRPPGLLTTCLLLSLGARAAGATAFGDFQSLATAANLKPFALDLGGALGGTAFHSGRALGFPGFDLAVVGTLQFRPDKDDLILRNAGVQRFGVPLVQVEVGLPGRFDLIAHGAGAQGARVFGGGLRYGVAKSDLISFLPDLAVSFFGDKLNHAFFSAVHYSANAVASFHLPIARPYAGFGWDRTTVTAGAAAAPGVAGVSATAYGTRMSLGLDLAPVPFLHAWLAYSLLHGLPGADAGLGLRF